MTIIITHRHLDHHHRPFIIISSHADPQLLQLDRRPARQQLVRRKLHGSHEKEVGSPHTPCKSVHPEGPQCHVQPLRAARKLPEGKQAIEGCTVHGQERHFGSGETDGRSVIEGGNEGINVEVVSMTSLHEISRGVVHHRALIL